MLRLELGAFRGRKEHFVRLAQETQNHGTMVLRLGGKEFREAVQTRRPIDGVEDVTLGNC